VKVSKAVLESIEYLHSSSRRTLFEGKWFLNKSVPNLVIYCFGMIPKIGSAVVVFDNLAIADCSRVDHEDVVGMPVCVGSLRGKYSEFEPIKKDVEVCLPRYAFERRFEYAKYYSYADRSWSLEPEGPIVEPIVRFDFSPFWAASGYVPKQ
jgi:hypothetical protein